MITLDKTFDYLVPHDWHSDGRADRLSVGSVVRVDLQGRRVRGWVISIAGDSSAGVELSPLVRLSGMGPTPELIELAVWAAWRWAGSRVSLMREASPPGVVTGPLGGTTGTAATAVTAARPVRPAGPAVEVSPEFEAAFDSETTVVQLPPAVDPVALALAATRRGDALIIVPELARARYLAAELRRSGVVVAEAPKDWARAGAGSSVVGARSAVWMPMPNLAAVVVIDEHDEGLKSGRTPAWHAREVALERARRADVPAVLVSPVPTLEALRSGRRLRPGRAEERAGWSVVELIDRRSDDPTRGGLFAEGLRRRLPGEGRILCVLNRKGRARLLACASCGELARSSDGRAALAISDNELISPDGAERRPLVCAECGSTLLKHLRIGVTRAREELEALMREPVGELTAERSDRPDQRVVIGTEAVLRRFGSAAMVVFLDFDQELLAPRQRAAEQALVLLARAARLVGPRCDGGRILVQTRQPDHLVLRAALRADPSLVASDERDRRRSMAIPPYGIQALVSGPGSTELIAALEGPLAATRTGAVEILGPHQGRFLLRASQHGPLLDALAATPRPAQRVRVEVDPLRV